MSVWGTSKGIERFFAGVVLSTIVLAFAYFAALAYSQPTLNADSFFTKLVDNYADLTYGIAVFEFKNPSTTDLTVDTNSFKIRTVDQPGATPIQSVNYYVLETVPYSRNITDYATQCSNITAKNGTQQICERIAVSWHWNNYTADEWKEFTAYTFKAGTTHRVKVQANWAAKLGPNSREWFPQVVIAGNTYEQIRWDWWNASWTYKKPITIINTNNPDTLTDYQVLLNISYADHMASDFSDLRFVNSSDGSTATVLPYALGKDVLKWTFGNGTVINLTTINSSYTDVVVNVDSIHAYSNTTIYVYYGNGSAESQSNPWGVYDFFDNTNGSSTPDSDLWISSPSVSESGGSIAITGSNSWNSNGILSKKQFDSSSNGYVISWNEKESTSVQSNWDTFFGIINSSSLCVDIVNTCAGTQDYPYYYSGQYDRLVDARLGFANGTVLGMLENYTAPWSWGTWYANAQVLNRSYGMVFYWNSGANSSSYTQIPLNIYRLQGQNNRYGITWYLSNFSVRKYSYPEPTYFIGDAVPRPNCTGTLVVTLLQPDTSAVEVQRNGVFTLQANATCVNGCCGNVEGIADPHEILPVVPVSVSNSQSMGSVWLAFRSWIIGLFGR